MKPSLILRNHRHFIALAVLAALGHSALGQTVVNWGGNYVSQTENLQGFNSQVFLSPIDLTVGDPDLLLNDSRMGRPFNTLTPFSPTSGYGGLGGLSETFYGGAMADLQNHTDLDTFTQMAIQNQGGHDMISFRVQQGNHQHRVHLSLYWDQADFLTGNAPFSFAPDGGMQLHIENSDQAQNDATGRWLVRQGGVFYLSQATFTPDNGVKSVSGAVLNSTQWAPWSPASSPPAPGTAGADMDFMGTSPSFAPLVLSQISAVGIFIEHDAYRDAYNFSIDGFQVSAVPEAGTWAAGLLTGALVAFTGFRQARARRVQPN